MSSQNYLDITAAMLPVSTNACTLIPLNNTGKYNKKFIVRTYNGLLEAKFNESSPAFIEVVDAVVAYVVAVKSNSAFLEANVIINFYKADKVLGVFK